MITVSDSMSVAGRIHVPPQKVADTGTDTFTETWSPVVGGLLAL